MVLRSFICNAVVFFLVSSVICQALLQIQGVLSFFLDFSFVFGVFLAPGVLTGSLQASLCRFVVLRCDNIANDNNHSGNDDDDNHHHNNNNDDDDDNNGGRGEYDNNINNNGGEQHQCHINNKHNNSNN